MANDRMYIRCKGCGDLHYLAKCYDDGYFTTHEGEELRQGLDDFFDRHKWCYRGKYYGGFELVYESDEDAESEEDEAMRNNIIRVLSCFTGNTECESNPSLSASYPIYTREIAWLKSLRPSWKPSDMNTNCQGCLYYRNGCKLPKGLDCPERKEEQK